MGEVTARWRVGEVIDGRYAVTGVHEDGGMGVVHRVRHVAWDIDLAVKSPRPELVRNAEGRRRFVAEAETWVSLGMHPHVCNCFYVRVIDGVPLVFAEYVPGGGLHEWIDDRRLYDGDPPEVLARIVDVAIQTAWGLDHAHAHGLVHRDVKPANVLLDGEDGAVTAKITDFGLARGRELAATVRPDAPPGASVPVPGGGGMTLRYASPEQAAGEPVGRRTDVYSFAVSVLEMCVGEATWMAGPAAGAALAGYDTGDVTGVVVMPPALGDLLRRCLRHDPDNRPNSMARVAAELIGVYRDVTGRTYPRPAPAAAELLADDLNNRAVSLLDLDRHDEADRTFTQALVVDPQNARAVYNAGLARWRRGDITDTEFITEIEAIRADAGASWEVRYVLAQVHLERGDLAAARGLLEEVARERPDEPEVRAALHTTRSGEIADARCVDAWPVPWPPRPRPFSRRAAMARERVALALSPDGRFAAAGGWHDGAIRFWDVHGGRDAQILKGHRWPVRAVDLTPDGRFAVSACVGDTVRFWDLSDRRFRGSPKGRRLYASPIPSWRDRRAGAGKLPSEIRLTPDGRSALYAVDGAFRVWDTHSGAMRILDDKVADELVEVSADGRWALSVRGRLGTLSLERTVRLWDLAGGRCELELPVPERTVSALCFSADGRFAAIGSHRTVRVWDLVDDRCAHVLTGRPMPSVVSHRGAYALALSADARFLLAGDQIRDDQGLQLWKLDRGRCLRTFEGHQEGTSALRMDADARAAFSVGQDRTVRRWDLPGEYRGAPLLSRPRGHVELSRLGGRVEALVAETKQEIAAGRFPEALDLLRRARAVTGYERAPQVMSSWWVLGRRAVRTGLRAAWSSRAWDTVGATAVDLTGDGRLAVSGDGDGTIRLWDTRGGDCLRVFEGHEYQAMSVCLSADGRRILSLCSDGGHRGGNEVRLWEAGTGACRRVIPLNAGTSRSATVRFSPDERQAVVGDPGGPIRVWDLETGELARELHTTGREFDDLCTGDGGRRLATTAKRDGVVPGELTGGRIVHNLFFRGSPPLPLGRVALGADGRFALSGSDSGLYLWDTATGEVVRVFDGPRGITIHTVRMTADGRFAVSGDYWSHMAVWDVGTGRCVRILDGHERGVNCLALTPDGRFILAGHSDGLRLWELDWELAAKEAADWDAGAAPYLAAFLRRHGTRWTDEDFDALSRRLEDVGYGWLRAAGVRARLDRMAAETAAEQSGSGQTGPHPHPPDGRHD